MAANENELPEESVAELEAALGRGEYLLDVRRPDEYAEAHVDGAVLITLDGLEDRLGEVPEQVRVHVICHSGARSARAVAALRATGRDAVNVAGGTAEWVRSGRAYATGG